MAASVVDAVAEVEEPSAGDEDRPQEEEEVPADQQMEASTDDDDDDGDDEDNSASNLPFPSFAPKTFYLLDQTTAPRRWCLQLVTSPYPFIIFFYYATT